MAAEQRDERLQDSEKKADKRLEGSQSNVNALASSVNIAIKASIQASRANAKANEALLASSQVSMLALQLQDSAHKEAAQSKIEGSPALLPLVSLK